MYEDSTPEIPFGYCHCGCGQQTRIAKKTSRAEGSIKGQPYKFVHGHYARVNPPTSRNQKSDLWKRVAVSTPNACWPFSTQRNPDGYGAITIGGKTYAAHRLAWELTHGPIPDGMEVCHRCDVPACCNPHHLFLGTHSDNMRDMRAKGRGSILHGELSARARLTNEDVLLIRSLRYEHRWKVREIAERFGRGLCTIENVLARKTWKHLP